jgi:predicted aspartyl protease
MFRAPEKAPSLASLLETKQNLQVAISSEIQRIAAVIENTVDSILGFDFLKDLVLTIDYQQSVFHLAPPLEGGNEYATRSDNSIYLRLASASKPLILVPATVDGQGLFQFVLDTGASRTMLSSKLVSSLGITTTEGGPVTGGGGQIKILAGRVNSLAVGHATVRDHAIGAGEFLNMLSTALGTQLDGIVGYNFLREFRIILDCPCSTLGLVPVLAPEVGPAHPARQSLACPPHSHDVFSARPRCLRGVQPVRSLWHDSAATGARAYSA